MKCFLQRLTLSGIVVVLLCSAGCDHEGAVLTGQSSDAENAGFRIQQITFLRDSSRTLGPMDVLGPPWTGEFKEVRQGLPSFGFSTAAVWCRVDLIGGSSAGIVAELISTKLDHVTWYELRDGKILQEVCNGWMDGERGESAPANYPALRVGLDAGETCTLLFRVESECALTLPIAFVNEKDFGRLALRRGYIAHLQVGASIAVVGTCLLLGLTLKDFQFTLLSLFGGAGFLYGAFYDPILSFQPFPLPPSVSRMGCSLAATVASVLFIAFSGTTRDGSNSAHLIDCC